MTLSIGDVTRETGFPASTLRYYEQIGLLLPPDRVSGRRAFTMEAVDRLHVIALARSLNFSLDEIRELIDGFPSDTRASDRWRVATGTKIEELEEQAANIRRMLGLLRHLAEECDCDSLASCARSCLNTDPDSP